MRQLSACGRLAVRTAAALAVLASAGCMSVSDEEDRKPAPRGSAERPGAAEPDGWHVAPGGQQVRGGKRDSEKDRKDDAKASPSPSGSASVKAKPSKGGQRQHPSAKPTPDGGSPSVPEPPAPSPDVPSEPPASPTPPTGEPTDEPSASSAPEVHAGAMRVVRGPGTHPEPVASPQVGPV